MVSEREGRPSGVLVAALVGRADRAVKQAELGGRNRRRAQGTEAGGHTGEIATMVQVRTAGGSPPRLMLAREEDVDAHALHARGWTISALARHLGHDRKTIRAYHPVEHAIVVVVDLEPDADPPRVLAIGPDRAGNLLEIIWLELENDPPIVIHALALRRAFHDLLPTGEDD